MQKLYFRENSKITLGVEVEVQLIDPLTRDLTPRSSEVLTAIQGINGFERVKTEIFQSMLEIDTPICSSALEAGLSLRSSLSLIRDVADKMGVSLLMAGSHPFTHYSDRLVTPASRYYSLMDRNQWIARRLQIFGVHVHLGMKNGDHAIAMNNALCHYLPIVLALSASSPYWHAEDTGLASSRITFFESTPTGGHPYLLNDWAHFEQLIYKLFRSKSITSLKDLWWDIRPNTEFGTIEVRIADCPPTLKETESLVALIHALALFIDKELSQGKRFAPPPEWILRENKWRASRYGVQCELIQNLEGDSISFLQMWNELERSLLPVIKEMNYQSCFAFLNQLLLSGPSYIRQRQHGHMGMKKVVDHLIEEGIADSPIYGLL